VPWRAGLEIWLEDMVSEDGERQPQYPRRLAGETTGERKRVELPGLALEAQLFHWHARGLDGAGVYVHARRA
jgi:hypothetical protein